MNINNNCEPSYIILISIDGMANYYLKDPAVKMPNLRKLIRSGTVAEAMESTFPTSTWQIHTSLVTGCYPRKHGILGNWVVDRKNRTIVKYAYDSSFDKEECVKVETIYDAVKTLGWTIGSICWPVTRGAKSIDFNIPEFCEQGLFEKYSTMEFWEELKKADLPIELYGQWSKDHSRGHLQDWLSTEVTKHMLIKHRPNLLLLHYLLPDTYQHDFGTRSREAYWALEYVDKLLGDIIYTLKEEGIWKNTTLFIVSDHGLLNFYKTLYPNVLFKKQQWLNEKNISKSKVIAVSNGGVSYVYIMEEDQGEKAEIIRKVTNMLSATKGVSKIFKQDEFEVLGLPKEGELSCYIPELIFEAEKDTAVSHEYLNEDVLVEEAKVRGIHGYLPSCEEMKGIFVAYGKGIPQGITLPEIKVIDVAPTIMNLIGGTLKNIDGQPLQSFWNK